jgi:hypothetical protein
MRVGAERARRGPPRFATHRVVRAAPPNLELADQAGKLRRLL